MIEVNSVLGPSRTVFVVPKQYKETDKAERLQGENKFFAFHVYTL